jgi:hypothetical protein
VLYHVLPQLHFICNYLGEMSGRQEMWMAHFTAACEVACRLSPLISERGLAVSLDESVWRPKPKALPQPDSPPPPSKPAPPTPSRPSHRRTSSAGKQLQAMASRAFAQVDKQMNARSGRIRPPPDGGAMPPLPPSQRRPSTAPPTPAAVRPPSQSYPPADGYASTPAAYPGAETLSGPSQEDVDALLARLREMGFGDDELTRVVLADCKHDVEKAISMLLLGVQGEAHHQPKEG